MALKCGMVSFHRLGISYASEWEDYSSCFGEGQRFPGLGPLPTPWSSSSALELLALLGMPYHLLIEDQGLVLSGILVPSDSHRFMLCPSSMTFFQKLCPAPFPSDTTPREHFMQRWTNKGQNWYGPNRIRRH